MTATSSVLNLLIETLKDGEKGYSTAAEDATRADLKDVFREYAEERSGYAAELQRQVMQLGDQPDTSGSLAGDLHRGWINLKSSVLPREDLAILEECIRGDESAVNTYTNALTLEHLGPVHPLLEKQVAAIKADLEHVRLLRDTLDPPDTPATAPVVLV